MCGICAGVKGNVKIGDLVVFSPVFDYSFGKYVSKTFYPDYSQRQINNKIRNIVEQLRIDKNFLHNIKDNCDFNKPAEDIAVHICPSCSGSAVVMSEEIIKMVMSHQRKLGAIDMESYAVAEAAHVATNKEVPWLIVKGVQDYANNDKDDKYRKYAAYISVEFLKKFIENYFADFY